MDKNINIRAITPNEYPLLDDFLYDAIFIPEGVTPPIEASHSSPSCKNTSLISVHRKTIIVW